MCMGVPQIIWRFLEIDYGFKLKVFELFLCRYLQQLFVIHKFSLTQKSRHSFLLKHDTVGQACIYLSIIKARIQSQTHVFDWCSKIQVVPHKISYSAQDRDRSQVFSELCSPRAHYARQELTSIAFHIYNKLSYLVDGMVFAEAGW